MQPRSTSAPRAPQLKLWEPTTGDGRAVCLSDFFSDWFLPVALEGEGKASSTIELYTVTMRLWVKLTGDPPLAAIDEHTISRFAIALRQETYTRGRTRDGRTLPGAIFRPFTADTIALHLRNLRAILNRCGPQQFAGRKTAAITSERFFVPCPRLRPNPQDCFSLERARAIVRAAELFCFPQLPGRAPWQWWRGFLGWLYVTDLRPGTVRQIERSMLKQKADGWWVMLPRELVPKTGKGKWLALPDWCVEPVLAIGDGPLFSYDRHGRTLQKDHKELQQLAGIPPAELLPLKAWRRTHATEMQRLGAMWAIEVSRRSLDHSHASTTTGHYADITEELRRKLPPLWDLVGDDGRQRRLF